MSAPTLDRERIVDAMLADFDTARRVGDLRSALRHLLDAGLPVVPTRAELDELPPGTVLLTATSEVVRTVRSCNRHVLVLTLDGSAPELAGSAYPLTVLALP